ncbi:hypothetical protein CC77DRAFT_64194 [Alternaria alternata]|uniref:Uncharacterized protein n=1 Tax=Alternaria alternata TaxID=5599 RepID=A0A177DMQ7_ALTAL|nr:hypothetical protein CC77DRAFT_64194 [Alternaria alternata]OAG20510.1 hypothetical protein CC77DRAFT_64194 [Alternaria alternata]
MSNINRTCFNRYDWGSKRMSIITYDIFLLLVLFRLLLLLFSSLLSLFRRKIFFPVPCTVCSLVVYILSATAHYILITRPGVASVGCSCYRCWRASLGKSMIKHHC